MIWNKNGIRRIKKTIISKVEELKLKNDFLCLQLNYEYENTDNFLVGYSN